VFHIAGAGTLTARADVINVFDREYQIRNGTAWASARRSSGPRRGYFFGLSKFALDCRIRKVQGRRSAMKHGAIRWAILPR